MVLKPTCRLMQACKSQSVQILMILCAYRSSSLLVTLTFLFTNVDIVNIYKFILTNIFICFVSVNLNYLDTCMDNQLLISAQTSHNTSQRASK